MLLQLQVVAGCSWDQYPILTCNLHQVAIYIDLPAAIRETNFHCWVEQNLCFHWWCCRCFLVHWFCTEFREFRPVNRHVYPNDTRRACPSSRVPMKWSWLQGSMVQSLPNTSHRWKISPVDDENFGFAFIHLCKWLDCIGAWMELWPLVDTTSISTNYGESIRYVLQVSICGICRVYSIQYPSANDIFMESHLLLPTGPESFKQNWLHRLQLWELEDDTGEEATGGSKIFRWPYLMMDWRIVTNSE